MHKETAPAGDRGSGVSRPSRERAARNPVSCAHSAPRFSGRVRPCPHRSDPRSLDPSPATRRLSRSRCVGRSPEKSLSTWGDRRQVMPPFPHKPRPAGPAGRVPARRGVCGRTGGPRWAGRSLGQGQAAAPLLACRGLFPDCRPPSSREIQTVTESTDCQCAPAQFTSQPDYPLSRHQHDTQFWAADIHWAPGGRGWARAPHTGAPLLSMVRPGGPGCRRGAGSGPFSPPWWPH